MKSTHCLLAACLAWSTATMAYMPGTHELLSQIALERSVALQPVNLERLGLNRSTAVVSTPDPVVLLNLVRYGAVKEDQKFGWTGGILLSRNHFFDPVRNIGLLGIFPTSPDWALQDTSRVSDSANDFSYKDAKDYLRNALITVRPDEYYRNMTLLFRTLGHVIHHIQDMAQPDHVRNDQHLDYLDTSWYEQYSFSQHMDPNAPNRAGFNAAANGGYPAVSFETPREFWTTPDDQGIADFTNANFVSKDTNFRLRNGQLSPDAEFGAPVPTVLTRVVALATLMPQTGAGLCALLRSDPRIAFPPNATCDVEFWASDVTDNFAGGLPVQNDAASSVSIFDQYLRGFNIASVRAGRYGGQDTYVTVDRAPSLNRFTYDAGYPFLLPKAVAYSTGLLDYFFRGQLELSLPDDGAFAVVDHAADGGRPVFKALKLRLKNVTPPLQTPSGPKSQEMLGGTLRAVVRYYHNPCYEPDLSGEIAPDGTIPSGCSISQYVSGTEAISVSAVQSIAGVSSISPTAVTFDFSAHPIPVGIRDAMLQVVWTGGRMGLETDAVVVGSLNMSEPTYLSVFNNTDYFALDGVFRTPEQIRNDPALLARIDFNGDGREDVEIDPIPIGNIRYGSGTIPWTDPLILQQKEFARLVVLADSQKPLALKMQYQFDGGGIRVHNTSVPPLRTQLVRDPALVSTMGKSRGFHHWYLLYLYQNFGAQPPVEAIKQLPAIVPPPQPVPVTVTFQ